MSSEPLDPRLKRLLFRAHHMGSNENDILFGGFARAHLSHLSPAQVDQFEALIALNDADLFDWVTGKAPVPPDYDHDVMALLRHFVQNDAACA
jgi:antitoxin CptB